MKGKKRRLRGEREMKEMGLRRTERRKQRLEKKNCGKGKEKGRERKGKEGERGTESLLRLSLSILCLSY